MAHPPRPRFRGYYLFAYRLHRFRKENISGKTLPDMGRGARATDPGSSLRFAYRQPSSVAESFNGPGRKRTESFERVNRGRAWTESNRVCISLRISSGGS